LSGFGEAIGSWLRERSRKVSEGKRDRRDRFEEDLRRDETRREEKRSEVTRLSGIVFSWKESSKTTEGRKRQSRIREAQRIQTPLYPLRNDNHLERAFDLIFTIDDQKAHHTII